MSANQGFAGFVYDKDDVLGNANIKYQGFFYKVNGASSPSAWSGLRTIESSGYYSIALSDGDWLTPDGNASAGDKVILVFWKPTSANRNDMTLTEWGAIEIVLTGSDTYIKDLQIKANQSPIISNFVLPATGERLVNITPTNEGNDEHSWTSHGTTAYQWSTRYGQIINAINGIEKSRFDWGDGTFDEYPSDGEGPHQWDLIDDYDVTLTITDYSGSVNSSTKTIRITDRSPVCGLTWLPLNPTIQQTAHFTPSIVDTDSKVTSVDYLIDGSPVYTGVSKTFEFDKLFSTNSNHTVRQVLHWNDGFEVKTTTYDFTVIMTNITPTVDFDFEERTSVANKHTFNAHCTDPDGSITNYHWEIWTLVGGVIDEKIFDKSGADLTQIEYTFSSEDDFRVILACTDNKGGITLHSEDIEIVMEKGVLGTCVSYVVKINRRIR